ncbi:hypothetical protein [Paracoccus ravus]|uniref:hypothetical protein n=1 Tax=Paracoccus ravus TaxID=2447760 RepID=UPI00106E4292|nr:hypothetical protein [Paracoccus ravus]
MQVLVEDENCLVTADMSRIAEAEKVIVSFTGVGHGMGGIDVQQVEFAGSASRHGVLVSVIDRKRSWGNGLDLPGIVARITALAAGRPILTLGNSMGGFLAILFSTPLNAERCVAIAAQYSVSPAVLPDERRWRSYRRAITVWQHPSLDGAFNPHTLYTTLNGGFPQDRRHWRRFPDLENARHYVLKGVKHNVAPHLKDKGQLSAVLDHALAGPWNEDLISGGYLSVPARRHLARA